MESPSAIPTSQQTQRPIPLDGLVALLPQRPPFLFVDEVLESHPRKIVAQKKITGDEDFFRGHFPLLPIMPGVLLLEALFQTGALLVLTLEEGGAGVSGDTDKFKDKLGVVTKVEGAKFKNFVRPGDTLTLQVQLEEQVQNAFYMSGKVTVAGKLVASCKFTCAQVAPAGVKL